MGIKKKKKGKNKHENRREVLPQKQLSINQQKKTMSATKERLTDLIYVPLTTLTKRDKTKQHEVIR